MIHEGAMGTALGGQRRSWWCPRVLSHLVQRQLLLDIAGHCIPDSLSLWKRVKFQVLLCFCWLSTSQHPWVCVTAVPSPTWVIAESPHP